MNRAGRFVRLWASLVLTTTGNWSPPGVFYWRGPRGKAKCVFCGGAPATLLEDHVVVCKAGHQYLRAHCAQPNVECRHFAIQEKGKKWGCWAGHEYAAPMCPDCWGIGVLVRANLWMCAWRGDQFVTDFALCEECEFGYLVSSVRSRLWTCEFCGKESVRRGR